MNKSILVICFALFLGLPSSGFSNSVTLEVGKKWDGIAIAPNTDWFVLELGPSKNSTRKGMSLVYDAPVKHTFQFQCPTSTVVKMIQTYNSVNKSIAFNGGSPITANDGHNFSVVLHKGMTYNIQHETGTQNCSLLITESFNVD